MTRNRTMRTLSSPSKDESMRDRKGTILLLVIITICLLIVPLLMVLCQNGLHVRDSQRFENTVEAAGLLAANDVSRIIINDQNFGYVSLSNYPPTGKGTCAGDGEPLPVIGINTLVGTIRQNVIIAHELVNPTMTALAEGDRNALDSTISDLNTMMKNSTSGAGGEKYYDIDGNRVDPVKDVTAFLTANLPDDVDLVSLKLSNGWLTGDARTTISIPQPQKLADVKPSAVQGDKYKAFIDVPTDKHSFTFAGLDATSRIVAPSSFRAADAKHICSIVKLECVLALKNITQAKSTTKLQFVSCCQPFTMPEIGPAGIMTLRFSGIPVQGLYSWSDLLKENNFRDNQISMFDAVGGDFPVDRDARMRQYRPDFHTSTAQQFGEHLYYWLRNGHLRPRLDAIMSMVNDPFHSRPDEVYVYEFANNGTISRRALPRDPFQVGVTADAQSSVIADTNIQAGVTPVIIFRNDVKRLGTRAGGKHGGQPLAGDPLNWCEMQEFGGDELLAQGLGKGRLGTRLTVVDTSNPAMQTNKSVNFDVFRKIDGRSLQIQPRKSFYSGGLALDIEIGGIRPSTARLDVASMRNLRFKRKV